MLIHVDGDAEVARALHCRLLGGGHGPQRLALVGEGLRLVPLIKQVIRWVKHEHLASRLVHF